MPNHTSGGWLCELTDDVIETLLRYGVSTYGSSPLTMVEVRQAGGQIARMNSIPLGHR
ncbi:MAG: hypothetical protein U0350_27035 [Caldilineaceae bacterium]